MSCSAGDRCTAPFQGELGQALVPPCDRLPDPVGLGRLHGVRAVDQGVGGDLVGGDRREGCGVLARLAVLADDLGQVSSGCMMENDSSPSPFCPATVAECPTWPPSRPAGGDPDRLGVTMRRGTKTWVTRTRSTPRATCRRTILMASAQSSRDCSRSTWNAPAPSGSNARYPTPPGRPTGCRPRPPSRRSAGAG